MEDTDIIKEALKNRRRLEIFSYSLVRDWGLAEDAVQDALVILYKKQGKLTAADNIYGWMKKIVRDKSIDIIRKRSKFAVYDSSLMDLVERSFESHDHILQEEKLKVMQGALEDCMNPLNDGDADLLKSFYLQKKKCETIAELINSTVNAVRLRLSRVRSKLRKCAELKMRNMGESF
ncbi:MAG: sigma-70 family RNA polymerase sigma factor [Lentisphaeraceae bacterium]|nr:sigma-70 family RNA polymerase sigma factor [Lentisphaeraceae bacterium]